MKAKSPLPFPPPGAKPSANKQTKKKANRIPPQNQEEIENPTSLGPPDLPAGPVSSHKSKATPKNLMSLIKRFATGSYMSACHSFSPHKNNVHLKTAKVTECVYIAHDALTPKDGRPVSIWVSPGLTP